MAGSCSHFSQHHSKTSLALTTLQQYLMDVPGLEQAVGGCTPEPSHSKLLKRVRSFEPLAEAKVATTRGGDGSHYFVRRKVVSPTGETIHSDHEAWLKEQLAQDAENAAATYARLRDAGLFLSRCEITTIFLVHDRGTSNPAEFFQVEIRLEEECIDAHLFAKHAWQTPKDLQDLIELVVGDPVPQDERRWVAPARYALQSVADVEEFVRQAEELEALLRLKARERHYRVSESNGKASADREWDVLSHDQLFPGWDKHKVKHRRIFDDWSRSSAGRSGARICDHWVMRMSDWTDPQTKTRYLSLVPMWTFKQKLASVDPHRGDAYTHYGKLQTLDRRVKVPFAWYFYMLHGNRVLDGSAKRVLTDAEAGLIVVPEHDYQVLLDWRSSSYGF